jgi:MFS family permease
MMLASAAVTCALAFVIWALVRDDPRARGFRSYADSGAREGPAGAHPVRNLIEVFRSRNTYLLCIIPAALVGSVLTFCGLWGVPFLTTHYGLSAAEAATLTSVLMVSWAMGSPFVGGFSDRIGRRKPLMLIGQALAAAGWSLILFVSGLPVWLLALLMVATGVCSASFNICWPLAKESVPLRLSGTISGVINMGIMIGPTILQPGIGWVLDRHWQGEMLAGVRVYSFGAYRAGFALMLGWMLLALMLLFFIRETHCRQTA